MAAAAMTSIPLEIGGTVFSAIGRAALWAIVKTFRAPVTTGLVVSMGLGTVFAATNALYLQPVAHPAPMFADKTMVTSSVPAVTEPVAVNPRPVFTTPKTVSKPVVVQQPVAKISAPIPAMPEAVAKIDHANVKAMQLKLTELGFYEGDADGFYGPKTAAAIRAFESKTGLTPVGALTPELLTAVANAKTASMTPKVIPPIVKTEPKTLPTTQAPAPTASLPPATTPTQNRSATELLSVPVAKLEQQLPKVIKTDPLVDIVQKVATTTQNALQRREVPTTNSQYIERVQRGLASLGFLRGKVDGVAGEETAKAIRNFEVYYNYKVTGEITPELVDMLAQAGAQI